MDEDQGGWEARRRDKIAAGQAKRRRRLAYAIAALIIGGSVAAGAWALWQPETAPAGRGRPAAHGVAAYNGTAVSVDLAPVGQDAAFYKYESSGKTVRFFAVLGSDGVVRTAFDNAYCCYRRDLGEHQDGASMVCNWCQKLFPIDELNRTNLDPLTAGRCCPAHLRNTVVGDKVVIERADLESGAYLFK